MIVGLAGIGGQRNVRERRRHAPNTITGTDEAFEQASEARIPGRTSDLSEGGCYVDTMSPFPAQTRVRIRITREQRSFESQATVVYSVAGLGMGWPFEASCRKAVLRLRKLMRLRSDATSAGPGTLRQC